MGIAGDGILFLKKGTVPTGQWQRPLGRTGCGWMIADTGSCRDRQAESSAGASTGMTKSRARAYHALPRLFFHRVELVFR